MITVLGKSKEKEKLNVVHNTAGLSMTIYQGNFSRSKISFESCVQL